MNFTEEFTDAKSSRKICLDELVSWSKDCSEADSVYERSKNISLRNLGGERPRVELESKCFLSDRQRLLRLGCDEVLSSTV